jgi:hypothetical protein
VIEFVLVPCRLHEVIHLDGLRPPYEALQVALDLPVVEYCLLENEPQKGLREVIYRLRRKCQVWIHLGQGLNQKVFQLSLAENSWPKQLIEAGHRIFET